MSKSTTIINDINMDRVTQIIISDHTYVLFTIVRRVLVVIDMTDKTKPILLLNRTCYTSDKLFKLADRVINLALETSDDEGFLEYMDTYIDMSENLNNDTIKEIYTIYRIILKDHNL